MEMSSDVPVAARSVLEEMLESLKKREEMARDVPPALPARPPSRGRLPSARRSLPLNFKIGDDGQYGEGTGWRGVQDLVFGDGIFGRKRALMTEQLEESPYDNGLGNSATRSSSASARLPKTSGNVSKKKLRVWCQPKDAKWELGEVQSVVGDAADVSLCNGKKTKVSKENLLPANPEVLDAVDDLIRLSYLNEPSVLHNLKCRYTHDLVYTKAGPVLVSINPFKKVPLYGNDLIAAYKQKTIDHPHVYSIADAAFNELMRNGTNQSIIISGESGAGKSETAKNALEYLAAVGSSSSGLEQAILQASPILEAFGNAKTSRNDNSSRFGKLTELHFNTSGRICGAKIQTFLLEKSRVVQRVKGERSYHVFYQLCAGAPLFLKEKLDLRSADDYEYLKQSGCLEIDDVDDAQRFHMLMEAFDIVKISKEDQQTAFAMLATVLWLGNIAFSTVDNENHIEVVFDEGVTNVAKLLSCEVHDLMLALSTCKSQGEDRGSKKLTLSEAIDARDALAQSIYASLFDWLVERINKSLEVGKPCTAKSISILDIYGFQSFNKNSFEQFCINYANERLQQHFTRHLLKLEQEEYIQDGIDWTSCDFTDNIECLNLFEKKPLGLFSFLDEETTRPKATDLSFANKIKEHLNGNPCFKGDRGGAFKIRHYAGEVLYHTNGFLEKNRGPLHSDSIQMLLSSGCQLPELFVSHIFDQTQNLSTLHNTSPVDSHKQSVGTMLKGQIFNLMQRLENTTPHFIRCIKPNNQQLSGVYEDQHVLQQLRFCGVLEVVRISRAGYPTRMTHQQFSERFGFLLLENDESQDPLSISVAILHQFNIPPEMYQVGYTKIFFRTGQIVALEEIRNRAMQGALWAQKRVRGLHARRSYLEMKKGATTLQSFIRGEIARRELQKHVKRPVSRIMFGNIQKDTETMQSEMSKPGLKKVNKDPSKNAQQKKDLVKDIKDPDSTELQKRVLKAEEALSEKDEEIAKLQNRIQQYKARCSEYEMKVETNDEMWQKKVTLLQINLAAGKKSIPDASPTHDYDSESGISTASRTPEHIPIRQPRASDGGLGRDFDGNQNPVGHLVKEFEQRSQAFDDDARQILEVKSGQSGGANTREEIRKLKIRFAAWKKDFRARLHEAKVGTQKLGGSGGEKRRRKWWPKRCSKP